MLGMIFFVLFVGCENKAEKLFKKRITRTIGKTINTSNIKINKNLKIATFICGDCPSNYKDLKKWKFWIDKYQEDVKFLIYYYSTDTSYFTNFIKNDYDFLYPVMSNYSKSFLIDNNLPLFDQRFHTLLLDENNEVILIGSPLYSEKLTLLYEREINKRVMND
jgi:hypothetical protein